MVLYTCDQCGKKFNHRTHYTTHVNRKYSCINNCHLCGKQFPSPSKLRRHLSSKTSCSTSNIVNEIKKLRKEITELKSSSSGTVINNNITNNINQGVINNTNNTIEGPVIIVNDVPINEFGKEDMSHITTDFIKKCLQICTFNKEDNSYPKAINGYRHLLKEIYDGNEKNRGIILVRDRSRGIYEVNQGGQYIRRQRDAIIPVLKHKISTCYINMLINSLPDTTNIDSDDESDIARDKMIKNNDIEMTKLQAMIMARDFTDDRAKKVLKSMDNVFDRLNYNVKEIK